MFMNRGMKEGPAEKGGAPQNGAEPQAAPATETDAKRRPTKIGLAIDREQKAVENRLLRTFFIDPEKWNATVEAELKKCPDDQREQFLKWLARSPFSRGPENWSEKDIPEFLRGKVDTPLDELRYRLEFFARCCDPRAERTVEEHAEQKHTLLEFPGAATFIDQSDSTKIGRGKGAKELASVTDWMHLYFRAASIPFRTMKDVLVGDALSGVTIAPEGNMVSCATDAARFLITVRAFFELHNKMVEYELKKYGHCRSMKINVRSALALSDEHLKNIILNKNEIQPLSVCDVMNFAARISGVPREGRIIVSREAKKHLESIFTLEKIDPAAAINEQLELARTELDPLMGKAPETTHELYKKLELLYTAARLSFLLFDIFERPNIKDEEIHYSEKHFLTEKEHFMKKFDETVAYGMKKGLINEDDIERTSGIKFTIEREFSKEQYSKRPKFKGYDADQLQVYILIDYKTFKGDVLATPPTSRFASVFLNDNGEEMCGLEKFVDDVGKAYGIPTKTNFNPLASFYVMYTMQLTGAPSFAYNVATRATGVMLYTLEKMQKNWNSQPDQYLAQLQKKLVERGVFDETGNINEEALKDYLAKEVALPSLTAELGLVSLFKDRDAFQRTEATARLMGRKIYYVDQEQGEEIADSIISMHLNSKKLLEDINNDCREKGVEEPIPQETLEVLGRISFREKNKGIEEAKGDEHDLAAQVIVMSRIIETDRHRKAFESDQPPQHWVSIYDDDIKGTNTVVYPFLARVYSELFLLTAEDKRVSKDNLE